MNTTALTSPVSSALNSLLCIPSLRPYIPSGALWTFGCGSTQRAEQNV